MFKFRRFFSFRIPESSNPYNQVDIGTFRSNSKSNSKNQMINNSAVLQKVRKRISMMISLCSAMRNKNLKPMTKEEVRAMTGRLRERVRVMDEKNAVSDIKKKIEKIE